MKIDKQKTSEGCLAVSLIALLSQKAIKLKEEDEETILFGGLKSLKLDFSTGHLIYLAKKSPNLIFEQYIDNSLYQKDLMRLKIPKNIRIKHKKITLKFLKGITKEGSVIIYIDKYQLGEIFHWPHFMVLDYVDDKKAIIRDPWNGKETELEAKKLIKSIISLRNKVKVCPKAIRILKPKIY